MYIHSCRIHMPKACTFVMQLILFYLGHSSEINLQLFVIIFYIIYEAFRPLLNWCMLCLYYNGIHKELT